MKIRCKLANAGTMINGVTFVPDGDYMISEADVQDDLAEVFLGIPGYEKVETQAAAPGRRGKANKGDEE